MDLLKFKVWDKIDEIWLDDCFISNEGNLYRWDTNGTICEVHDRDRYEIFKSTGTYDKIGTLIFDGDFVEWEEHYYGDTLIRAGSDVVIYNAEEAIFTLSYAPVELGPNKNLVVTGNIKDNHDLITTKKFLEWRRWW